MNIPATSEAASVAPSSTRASSFYTAMRIMPPKERDAMYEIYHFCRLVDDIADEGGTTEERLTALNQWRQNIDLLYEGRAPLSLHGLAKAIAQFDLRKQDFLAVIDGMEMDVHGPIIAPDTTTLDLYCDRVACAVGRLSVRVFGMQEEDGLALAHHLGRALQLTNILRDIDEDAGIGRLYLPSDLLNKAGITERNPVLAIANSAVVDVCREIADMALENFAQADSIMKRYEQKRIRTPRIMSQAYHSILTQLIKRGFAPPRTPIRLNKLKLGIIVLKNILF